MKKAIAAVFFIGICSAQAEDFAQLDPARNVIRVVRASPAFIATGKLGNPSSFLQTFTSGQRKNYAGPGYTYDQVRDYFAPPKPFPSWQLNHTTGQWESPVPRPGPVNGHGYDWREIPPGWVLRENGSAPPGLSIAPGLNR